MVEYFTIVRPLAHFDAAHTVSADRMALLDPVDHVEIMDVLFDDVVASNPYEVVPVAQLVLHLRQLAVVLLFQLRSRMDPRRGAVPVAAHRNDIANRAIPQAIQGFDVAQLMMALEADADFQILLLRCFSRGEDASHAGRVGGHGLFHEDVLALFDRFLEMNRTKTGRGRQNYDI